MAEELEFDRLNAIFSDAGISPAAAAAIAKDGLSPEFGARPMKHGASPVYNPPN